ncbi:MAG: hypothetical protein AAB794_00145 [Patescibacteria group bacterium]
MAKVKYVVAGIRNYFGRAGEQGMILGEFRKIEFARRVREQMLQMGRKKQWSGRRGIFLNGKFVEEL